MRRFFRAILVSLLLLSLLNPAYLHPEEDEDEYFNFRRENQQPEQKDPDLKKVLENTSKSKTRPEQTYLDSDTEAKQDSKKDTDADQQVDPGLEEEAIVFDGSIRQLLHAMRNKYPEVAHHKKNVYTSYTRMQLGWEDNDPEASWSWQLRGNIDLISSNYQNSVLFDSVWRNRMRNRLLDMEDEWVHEKYLFRSDIHRASVAYRQNKFDLTLGRQAISWGAGRFLNPLDLITPSGPFILDTADVPGADAINFRYYLNDLDFLEFVGAPYRRMDDTRYSHLLYQDVNALTRYKFTNGDLDSQIILGHHFHSWVLGLEGSFTLKGAGLRLAYLGRRENHLDERAYYDEEDPPPEYIHQLVLGASYAFFKGFLRTNAEVFLNSNPLSENNSQSNALSHAGAVSSGFASPLQNDDSFFMSNGRIHTRNPILWQFSVGFNATDISTLDLILLWDPMGHSAFWSPIYTYDISDSLRFVAGAQLYSLPYKEEYSTFAGGQATAFMYMTYYFY